MYYNTTNLKLDELRKEVEKADNQEQRVFKIINGLPLKAAGPSTIHYIYSLFYGNATPLSSIRRAVTNLTRSGKLEKTFEKTKGSFNKPEYIWRVKD